LSAWYLSSTVKVLMLALLLVPEPLAGHQVPSLVHKATGMLATVFFITSLSLAYTAKNAGDEKSLMERVQEQTPIVETAPEKVETDAPMVPESEMTKASAPAADSAPDVPADVPGKP
jgi:preprotein translocase subunit SecG